MTNRCPKGFKKKEMERYVREKLNNTYETVE